MDGKVCYVSAILGVCQGKVGACRIETLSPYEIGSPERLPCAVANGQHPHRLPLFIEFIDDAIDVRLLAVEQLPQLAL
jgi:hypothetical protein